MIPDEVFGRSVREELERYGEHDPINGGDLVDFVLDLFNRLYGRAPYERGTESSVWKQEFGADFAVPEEILGLLSDGLIRDVSCRDDGCPSFQVWGEDGHRLWVDHPVPSQRDFPDDERFRIHRGDADALFTNSVGQVVAYLRRD